MPSVGHTRTRRHKSFHRRAFGQGFCDTRRQIGLSGRHYRFDMSLLAAVHYIVGHEQMCRRNSHSTEFMERDYREPELTATLEHKHHTVAAAYAERGEKRCRPVGRILHVGISVRLAATVLVSPGKAHFIRGFLCPLVNDIIAEIKIFGHREVEIGHKIVVRNKSGLL